MEHESEIVAFEAARLYFTRIGENPDKINLTDLFADYRLIKEDKFVTGLSLKEAGKEINNLDIISKNVEDALGIELVEREKQNQIKENTKKKVTDIFLQTYTMPINIIIQKTILFLDCQIIIWV